jgi:hypothetical protein
MKELRSHKKDRSNNRKSSEQSVIVEPNGRTLMRDSDSLIARGEKRFTD